MEIRRGLIRLWVLFTVLWFAGVAYHIWDVVSDETAVDHYKYFVQRDKPAPKPVEQMTREEIEVELAQMDAEKRDVACINVETDDRVCYDFSPYRTFILNAWTLAVPIVVWLLGYGVLWVMRGFRSHPLLPVQNYRALRPCRHSPRVAAALASPRPSSRA